MNRFPRPRGARGAAVTAVAGLFAAAAVAATPAAASAQQTSLTVKYPVTGTTVIKTVNATVKLGPGTLKSTVDLTTGASSSSLTLPPATASFKQLGLVPVKATTAFIQDGPAKGKVDLNTGAVTTTAHMTIQVTKLVVSGLPVPVGNSCKTAKPATVTVKSKPGFNIVNGGKLGGTYTIPQFANCGLVTLLLNLTIPGPGNTISLTLGKGTPVG